MKPRLTIAVRRGLSDMAALAGADVDADRSAECPQFTGQRLRDFDAALRWVACLERFRANRNRSGTTPRQPPHG